MDEAAKPLNYVSLPGEGAIVDLLGTRQVFKAEAQQTDGNMLCADITVVPGSGIPPHRHTHEDEAFYVVSGQVVIDGEDTGKNVLKAGSFFYGPRGRVHAFRNESAEEARLLVVAAPGGELGAMYTELGTLLREDPQSVDAGKLAEVCGRHGIDFVSA